MDDSALPVLPGSDRTIPFQEEASYPPRAGNRVRPLVDGLPAFRRICAAVEAARHSVWLTVAFITPDFRLPDGRGSLFDLLEGAVARGLDVRVIFWRIGAAAKPDPDTFSGTPADRAFLAARGSRLKIRWDQAPGPYCQHEKIWLIDAGQPEETAFVGGINLTPRALVPAGHAPVAGVAHQVHDLFLEIAGPSVSDLHHGFVQRWNEASERLAEDGLWGHPAEETVPFPTELSAPKAAPGCLVQVQRQVLAGGYSDGRPSPGGRPYPIAEGERTILRQYLAAIEAAQRTIYIENQAVAIEPILARLATAVERGVEVVMLVPAEPEPWAREARRDPARRAPFERLAALGEHENFTLAGLAAPDGQGGRSPVYVHSKAMLVDDSWATAGSCNLHANSLTGHTETNLAVRDEALVRALRCTLFAEHLGEDTAELDDRAALRLFREVARENAARGKHGGSAWRGLAFALAATTYGE